MEAVVSTLLPLLLHGLHEYGYPVLWLAVFIAAVGLPLPALGGVTNLLAGAEHYPYRSFLLCDITGDALGVAIPLSLGYGLGACWKAGGNLLSIFSWVIFTFFLVVLVVRRLLHTKEA